MPLLIDKSSSIRISISRSVKAKPIGAIKLIAGIKPVALPSAVPLVPFADPVGAVNSITGNVALATAEPLAVASGEDNETLVNAPVALPSAVPLVPVAEPVGAVNPITGNAALATAEPLAVASGGDNETLVNAPVALADPDAVPVRVDKLMLSKDPAALPSPDALAVGAIRLIGDKLPFAVPDSPPPLLNSLASTIAETPEVLSAFLRVTQRSEMLLRQPPEAIIYL